MEELNKTETVEKYLNDLLESGAKTKEQIFKMTRPEIADALEIDVSISIVGDGFREFKKQHGYTGQSVKSGDPVPSVPSGDLDPFLSKLKGHEDVLFDLLENQQRKKEIQEMDLKQSELDEIREYIMEEHQIDIDEYKSSPGIGVKINKDIYTIFRNYTKRIGLSQRYAINLSIKLFCDYLEDRFGDKLKEADEE